MAKAEGIRARNRAAIEEEILAVARKHLAENGAAALSLRAVARDLGMVSSALYRYVKNRDDLLTLLIVNAYTSLGDAVEKAHAAAPREDLEARWAAVGHGLRDWSLAHPHEYSLLYGSPVPDYDAPAEQTNAAGTRMQALLVRILADAQQAGQLRGATHVAPALEPWAVAAAEQMLADEFFAGTGLDEVAVMAGLAAWTLLLGTVSTELFHQLGDTVPDPDAYFSYMLVLAGSLILAPPASARGTHR